mmetsp:Transcript_14913/g.18147  ORF Transcript_14913/g.18147 Transcript_14913/m.18147 type:complete len:155 (+) Transcript_14913:147-611(+)
MLLIIGTKSMNYYHKMLMPLYKLRKEETMKKNNNKNYLHRHVVPSVNKPVLCLWLCFLMKCMTVIFFFESDAWDSWYDETDAIVFIGTSFAVQLTSEAIKRAKRHNIALFNINLKPPPAYLKSLTNRSIMAPCDLILPRLYEHVQQALLRTTTK